MDLFYLGGSLKKFLFLLSYPNSKRYFCLYFCLFLPENLHVSKSKHGIASGSSNCTLPWKASCPLSINYTLGFIFCSLHSKHGRILSIFRLSGGSFWSNLGHFNHFLLLLPAPIFWPTFDEEEAYGGLRLYWSWSWRSWPQADPTSGWPALWIRKPRFLRPPLRNSAHCSHSWAGSRAGSCESRVLLSSPGPRHVWLNLVKAYF